GREDKSGTTMQKDKSGTTTQGREDKMGAQPGQKGTTDTQKGAQTSPQGGSQTTTGMAPAAPPAEKRSQITTAIKSENIQETTVNVNVSVGTRLPATVR